MNNFIQSGDVVTLTAPSGGVTSGNGYKIGQLFVVAANTAAATEEFEGKTDGVYTLPKTTGTAWTEGVLLYWDDSTDKATTVAEDNLLIGCAAAAADSADATGAVRLNGTARPSGSVADDAVDTDAIANGAVTAAKLGSDSVTTVKILDANVTTAKIADSGVTFAKAAMFVSTEQTGDGTEQSVAHGLGAVPAAVLIVPTDTAPATAGDYTSAQGTHTSTNVLVTVTNGKKYVVWAMA
jgi:predicted RecA/RadA family phage recombinase